jgi:hypothetical protein
MSSVENAAYAVVHATRDRARDIAEMTGISLQVLLNKVNPNNDRNHLMLSESVAIQKAAADHRILFAEADELGYVCLPKPDQNAAGSLVGAIAQTCVEFGDYMRQVDLATEDGEVTPNEMKLLGRELSELIAAATHLQALVGASSRE